MKITIEIDTDNDAFTTNKYESLVNVLEQAKTHAYDNLMCPGVYKWDRKKSECVVMDINGNTIGSIKVRL